MNVSNYFLDCCYSLGGVNLLTITPASCSIYPTECNVRITEVIVEKVEKVSPNVGFNIAIFHHLVRKNSHFFIYWCLVFLWCML